MKLYINYTSLGETLDFNGSVSDETFEWTLYVFFCLSIAALQVNVDRGLAVIG